MAENASEPRTGVCNRRIHGGSEELWCADLSVTMMGTRSCMWHAARKGFKPALREELFRRFRRLETAKCPFANLPEITSGRWGAGLVGTKMKDCRWLKPELIASSSSRNGRQGIICGTRDLWPYGKTRTHARYGRKSDLGLG
jgi:hypothetical protein